VKVKVKVKLTTRFAASAFVATTTHHYDSDKMTLIRGSSFVYTRDHRCMCERHHSGRRVKKFVGGPV
jgi:ribosomal protein S12